MHDHKAYIQRAGPGGTDAIVEETTLIRGGSPIAGGAKSNRSEVIPLLVAVVLILKSFIL